MIRIVLALFLHIFCICVRHHAQISTCSIGSVTKVLGNKRFWLQLTFVGNNSRSPLHHLQILLQLVDRIFSQKIFCSLDRHEVIATAFLAVLQVVDRVISSGRKKNFSSTLCRCRAEQKGSGGAKVGMLFKIFILH